jgi:hypothetical protein
MNKNKGIYLAGFAGILLVLVLCAGAAFAVPVPPVPTLTAYKSVNPSSLNEGDIATISFTLNGTGTPSTTRLHLDVMLLLDKSGSMASDNKLEDAQAAAKTLNA